MRFHRCGNCDCCRIRTAAAESRNIALLVNSLEAGNNSRSSPSLITLLSFCASIRFICAFVKTNLSQALPDDSAGNELLQPIEISVIERRAVETCSPVEMRTSISLGSGSGTADFARSISRFVSPAMALTINHDIIALRFSLRRLVLRHCGFCRLSRPKSRRIFERLTCY